MMLDDLIKKLGHLKNIPEENLTKWADDLQTNSIEKYNEFRYLMEKRYIKILIEELKEFEDEIKEFKF